MNQSLIPVTFHDDTLYLVEHNQEPYTPARQICDALGLSWGAQTQKLKSKRWGCSLIETPSEGGVQKMLCLPLRKLPGWLMSISPAKVKPEVREKLERYQDECDDVLWRYWNGQVVKKAQPQEPPKALPYATKEQREPLVKAIRRVVKVAEARGRKLGYDEAHAIVNLKLGVENIEQMTTEQVQQGIALAGEMLERVVLEGEYIRAGEEPAAAKPKDEDVRLTPEEKRKLNEALTFAIAGWDDTGGAQWAINRLRVRLNLQHIDDLRRSELPIALEELAKIHEEMSPVFAFRSEFREFVNREVIGAGTPWTPYLARQWRERMKKELPVRPDWLSIQ